MKTVIAIDSFKGSLSSLEAANAASIGIRRVFSDAECRIFPIADGGEGTVDALASLAGAVKERVMASDPLGRRVLCEYLILGDGTAVIEMASAAGLTRLTPSERDPMRTTTYGVGEMILDAIGKGCRRFLIGIGGSATNDCGIGMLTALGFSFTDDKGAKVGYGAEGVRDVRVIGTDGVDPAISECTFSIACDVSNPLCGPQGCSAVYAPQKGADAEGVRLMDEWLASYAALVKTVNPAADPDAHGAGAAGGMGFAFLSFLGATLESGIDLVLRTISIEKALADADIVITGEGRLDSQTVMGKAPVGIARLAKRYGKPVVAFSGCVTDGARLCNENGIDAYFPIVRGACPIEEAMDVENAARNLADTAEQVFRWMRTVT